jgi:hypothetical protein
LLSPTLRNSAESRIRRDRPSRWVLARTRSPSPQPSRVAVQGADVFQSSIPAAGGAGKSAKLDVYSYEIKFVVVTNGGINPVWKLANVSAGTGNLPLVSAGRTRTHDLTLTFGPGTNAPLDFALQTHFAGQVIQSLQQRTPPIVIGPVF